MQYQGSVNVDAAKLAARCVPLGGENQEDAVSVEVEDEDNAVENEEKIAALEQKLYEQANTLDSLFAILKNLITKVRKIELTQGKSKDRIVLEKNTEEISEGTVFVGEHNGTKYYLLVKADGYYVGEKKYPSLSAAAEGVSGVRRSGWTFWHLADGRTAKEVFKG